MRPAANRALRAVVSSAMLALVALAPGEARADDTTAHELRYDVAADMAVIGGSVALVLASEYFKIIKPQHCRWCDRYGDEDRLNGLDRWARNTFLWKDPRSAQFASGVTAFLLQPAAATFEMIAASTADKAGRAFAVDFLIISEAIAVSTLLNQTTKILFARERPFVHNLPPEERLKTALPSDNNVSFYSGHTTLGFTLAAAAGTVATLRGYRLMPLVWATLMPLAATTGILRIGADKHYFTDVVVGAAVGTAVGVLLPVLFHGRDGDAFVPDGTGLAATPGSVPSPLRPLPSMVNLSGGF